MPSSPFSSRLARLAAISALAFTTLAPKVAHAEEPAATIPVPHPYAYGILVGSNVGGEGQTPLRYAEDDARKMAEVLKQLGRYGTADMRVLVRPSEAALLGAIDDVAQKMKVHAQKGEQAELIFYYSGHAKANAFSLGSEELSIATLREKLRSIPSTLTLVVLDACQSGQFARVKGAEPAADFSFNSVSRLTTKGIAVMASSSAQELSQESDQLKGSYFTHHLITALRGAADTDGDGRVSLDEAYRYAYKRTLASTAQTKVGSQHVTLDTDLAGQGEVPVTYPADSKSQLELPGPLDAKVLVQQKASGSVVAEVQKSPGAPLRLAFTSGAYEAIVRPAGKVLRCNLALVDDRVTTLDLGGCEEIKIIGVAKGEDGMEDAPPDMAPRGDERPVIEPWSIEGTIGTISHKDDSYTRKLRDFGYDNKPDPLSITPEVGRPRFTIGASHGVYSHIVVGGMFTTLSGDTFTRTLADTTDTFTFSTYGVTAFVRASLPLGSRSLRRPYAEIYGQLGGGLTLGFSSLTTGAGSSQGSSTSSDKDWGYDLEGIGGLAIVTPSPITITLQAAYDYAPTISNLLGDTHDSGGFSASLGLRVRFGQ